MLGLAAVVATPTAHAQTYTIIHNFMGGADGDEPNYGLTIDTSGNLYGTTFGGDSGQGTVFMLSPGSPAWTLPRSTVLPDLRTGPLPMLQSSSAMTAVSTVQLDLAEYRIHHAPREEVLPVVARSSI